MHGRDGGMISTNNKFEKKVHFMRVINRFEIDFDYAKVPLI